MVGSTISPLLVKMKKFISYARAELLFDFFAGVGPVTSKTLIRKYDTIDAIVASNPAKYGDEAVADFKFTEARELLTNGDENETERLEMSMPVKLKKIKRFLLEKSNVKDADLTKEKKLKCFRPKKLTMDNFFGAARPPLPQL